MYAARCYEGPVSKASSGCINGDSRYTRAIFPAGRETLNGMNQLLVITAIGQDRAGVVHDLSKKIHDCDGNIVESRMTALGNEFAMLLLVSGNWHAVGRLEKELPEFGETNNLSVTVRRTETRSVREDQVPYAIDVVSLDQPGIVTRLASFFAARGIEISELTTHSYAAAHTGAPMFSVQMAVNIPTSIAIAVLRDEFMEYCEELNVDAIMEPMKT